MRTHVQGEVALAPPAAGAGAVERCWGSLQVWSLGVMLYLLVYPTEPPFMWDTTGQKQIKYKPSEDPIQD